MSCARETVEGDTSVKPDASLKMPHYTSFASDWSLIICSLGMSIVRSPQQPTVALGVASKTKVVSSTVCFCFCCCTAPSRTQPVTILLCRLQLTSLCSKCSVLVLKKLDDENLAEFIKALRHLAQEELLTVVVEPHEYDKLVCSQNFSAMVPDCFA